MGGGGYKLKVQGTDSYPVNEYTYVYTYILLIQIKISRSKKFNVKKRVGIVTKVLCLYKKIENTRPSPSKVRFMDKCTNVHTHTYLGRIHISLSIHAHCLQLFLI